MIAAGRLDDSLVADVRDLAGGGELVWRDGPDAAAFRVDQDARTLRALLGPLEAVADIIVVDRERFMPVRLFVADMDSTVIGQECIDELGDYAGFKPEVAAITERAMQGEIDFAIALEARVALLNGLDRSVIARCLAERITATPGAQTLVATLKAKGAHTLLVSGGFTDFVRPVATRLGFDAFRANVLEANGETLTGRTVGPIVDAAAKRQAAAEALASLGLGPQDMLAVGDGANDSAMIDLAGTGIGYRPKPALAAVADGSVRHHDLSALLWAVGIPRAEWVD